MGVPRSRSFHSAEAGPAEAPLEGGTGFRVSRASPAGLAGVSLGRSYLQGFDTSDARNVVIVFIWDMHAQTVTGIEYMGCSECYSGNALAIQSGH